MAIYRSVWGRGAEVLMLARPQECFHEMHFPSSARSDGRGFRWADKWLRLLASLGLASVHNEVDLTQLYMQCSIQAPQTLVFIMLCRQLHRQDF